MPDVFLSYASADRERAREIAAVFRERGWSVWWDQSIPPGRIYDGVIEEALDASRCIVVLWTTASVESDWVKNEAEEGARRGILVPVLLENTRIPFAFRRIQAANLVAWKAGDTSPEMDLLLRTIAERVYEAQGPEPAAPVSDAAPARPVPEALSAPPARPPARPPPARAVDDAAPPPAAEATPPTQAARAVGSGSRKRAVSPSQTAGFRGWFSSRVHGLSRHRRVVIVVLVLLLGPGLMLYFVLFVPPLPFNVHEATGQSSRISVRLPTREYPEFSEVDQIRVLVRDTGYIPIRGAKVEFTSDSTLAWQAITESSQYPGNFLHDSLTPGRYILRVSHQGYRRVSGHFSVERRRMTLIDAVLIPR